MISEFRSQIMKRYWSRDATQVYRELLDTYIKPGMKLLHLGCGWDKHNISRPYKDISQVVGIDLDPRVESLFHSKFYLGSAYDMPFPDESFDVIFSEYVFEHFDAPASAFKEIRRVLKPDGRVIILTPNFFSYKVLGAYLTPQSFHLFMGRIRYGKGHETDMYPTLYKCNTLSSFKRFAKAGNFQITAYHYVTNGPTWFQKFPIIFEIFHFYHLAIARWDFLKKFRCALIVELRKMA